jgi:hypothetical protein
LPAPVTFALLVHVSVPTVHALAAHVSADVLRTVWHVEPVGQVAEVAHVVPAVVHVPYVCPESNVHVAPLAQSASSLQ